LKRINEFKYKNVFELELDNQNLGVCFKEIYDNILETKKRKEIGNDLKLMLKNNFPELPRETAQTEKSLDVDLGGDGHSDPGSVKSDELARST